MFASSVFTSVGFSLRILVLARPKPRRLKPALLKTEPNTLLPAPCRRVNLAPPVPQCGTEGTRTHKKLALAELEALAGALLPVLLAFLHA
jgi:hypothetical protein